MFFRVSPGWQILGNTSLQTWITSAGEMALLDSRHIEPLICRNHSVALRSWTHLVWQRNRQRQSLQFFENLQLRCEVPLDQADELYFSTVRLGGISGLLANMRLVKRAVYEEISDSLAPKSLEAGS